MNGARIVVRDSLGARTLIPGPSPAEQEKGDSGGDDRPSRTTSSTWRNFAGRPEA